MTPDEHDSVPLSADGRRRRDEMLPQLQAALRRHHGRRRAARHVAVAVLLVAVVGVAAAALRAPSGASRHVVQPPDPDPAPTPTPHISSDPAIRRVTASPDVLDRFVQRAPSIVERISDDELIRALDGAGRPATLIRREGEARVVFNGT